MAQLRYTALQEDHRRMDVDVYAVPYDSAQRGERMGAGPAALLSAGLAERLERRGRTVRVETIEPPADHWRAEIRTAFDLAAALSDAVRATRAASRFPLVLAGNCGVSLGVCAALGADAAVVWADAHGDFNTPETTVGGFLDGMALATLTGRCWRSMAAQVRGFVPISEKRIWLVGARDLDAAEARALASSAIHRVGVAEVGASTIESIAARVGESPVYLHIDLDVLDESAARANSYAVGGGLSPEALAGFCRELRSRLALRAVTISAYDPAADADAGAREAAFALLDELF